MVRDNKKTILSSKEYQDELELILKDKYYVNRIDSRLKNVEFSDSGILFIWNWSKPNSDFYKNNSSYEDEVYLDTKYLSKIDSLSFESLFDNIEDMIDWYAIHSDNYHFLKNVQQKYNSSIDLIWIDPPFNTENDQFIYKDKFTNSTWLSLIENRVQETRDLLTEKWSFYIHLDENADYLAKQIINKYLNYQRTITWNIWWVWYKTWVWLRSGEICHFYSKSNSPISNPILKSDWKIDFDKMGNIWWKTNDEDALDKEEEFFASPWTIAFNYETIKNLYDGERKTTQKPERYLAKYVKVSSNKSPRSIVMDYFAWTWTTCIVAQKLWRKWIWVNQVSDFNEIFIKRMKKVILWEQGWISKEYNWCWWWFFKYYSLEQYEDVLSNTVYWEHVSSFDDEHTDMYAKYIFLADEKMTRAISRDEESGTVIVDLSKLYPDIDIPETLSHLLGKKIKTIKGGIVTFADGQKIDTQNLDYNIVKPLIWWK